METNFRNKEFILAQLRDTLVKAQNHREERTTYNIESGRFGWNEYEEEVMRIEVNLFREMFGKKPVGIENIRKADDAAAGHIDYTQKFVLNCIDLIYGE